MAKEKIITSLDIGSSSVKVLSAKRNSKDDVMESVLMVEEKSDGIRKGTVVDIEKTSNVLRNVFSKVSQDLDQQVNSAYINLGGSHLFSTYSKGLVSVSRADKKISEEDIQRVLQAAQAISLPSNQEIFEIMPKEFIVDGERGIREPIGLEGVRLEAEVLALGGFSPYLQNARKVIVSSGLEALDMVPSSIAAARAVLSERQKELGVALLDIGAGITNLAVYEEGNLIHLAVLPMGSANVTADIAIILKTDIDTAEKIKISHGTCVFKGRDAKKKVAAAENGELVFSQKLLTKIIADRVSEIFEQANEELKKISKEKLLPAGVVLTGGGAKLSKIAELAKKKFALPCFVGRLKGVKGIDRDPVWATACGLVLMGAELEDDNPGFWKRLFAKTKKMLRVFIP